MSDYFELTCFILGFIGLGYFINHVGTILYWTWYERKNRKDR